MTATQIGVGHQVPDVTLQDENGNDVRLRDFVGRTLVLYFYPKDDTSGCTTQACSIRDEWATFDRDDVAIFGVSPDGVASHRKFHDKLGLPFHLLVDEDHALADQFGFWIEKSMYGKTYWGVERSTVVVGPDGLVQAVKRKVKPAEHTAWLADELGL
jgi:peroxiredoxin Q/BCP